MTAKKPFFDPVVGPGETFGLDHLDPFKFQVHSLRAKKSLRVDVRFSNHCFTRGYEAEHHPDGFPILFDAGGRPRSFCPERYQLSLNLPAVVASLQDPTIAVWQTATQRNWAYSIPIQDATGTYHVFFELRRAPVEQRTWQDLSMVVESAYPEGEEWGAPDLLGKMAFGLLCGRLYMGEPVSTRR